MMNLSLIGNLTRDPEVRKPAGGGDNYTTFDVAVNRMVGDEKKTQYVHVSAFGRNGVNCAKYLAKGSKVYVEGWPDARGYKTRDGATAASLNVAASHVEFLSTPRSDDPSPAVDDQGFAAVEDDDEQPF